MAQKVPVQGMVPEKLKRELVEVAENKGVSLSELIWLMLSLALKEKLYERF